jgi:hypothetical protein
MTYIPKNKIKTNLYTPGDEFIYKSNGIFYIGNYHKLYNNTFFTGPTPNYPNKQELIQIPSGIPNDFTNSLVSTDIIRKSFISYSPLLPTEQDYKNGEFTRYFIVKRNEPVFSEVLKKEYDKYKNKQVDVYWRLFKPISLFWVLTGDITQVAKTNKNVTELIEQREQAFGLSLYLKEDWIQYYKEKP